LTSDFGSRTSVLGSPPFSPYDLLKKSELRKIIENKPKSYEYTTR
jgi:hypothetical protein